MKMLYPKSIVLVVFVIKQICSSVALVRTEEINLCEDSNDLCCDWAKASHCRNGTWALLNCQRSCGSCGAKCLHYPHATCVDDNKLCTDWAKSGYCTANDWMIDHCRSSCGVCGRDPADFTTVPYTSFPKISCIERFARCHNWTRSGCNEWLRTHCQVSCRSCKFVEWTGSTNGQATTTAYGQTTNDPRNTGSPPRVTAANVYSRLVYSTVAPPAHTRTPGGYGSDPICEDRHSACGLWAKTRCNVWMINNCPKSCNACGIEIQTLKPNNNKKERLIGYDTSSAIQNKCLDQNLICEQWAKHGHCKDGSWVSKFCRKSCDKCKL